MHLSLLGSILLQKLLPLLFHHLIRQASSLPNGPKGFLIGLHFAFGTHSNLPGLFICRVEINPPYLSGVKLADLLKSQEVWFSCEDGGKLGEAEVVPASCGAFKFGSKVALFISLMMRSHSSSNIFWQNSLVAHSSPR